MRRKLSEKMTPSPFKERGLFRKIVIYTYALYPILVLRFYVIFVNLTRIPLIGRLFRKIYALYGEFAHGGKVTPYEKVMELIDKTSEIALGPCDCRKYFHRCNYPLLTDLRIGLSGEAWIKLQARDFKKITQEEAKRVIKECYKVGLVSTLAHCVYPHTYAVCNCCPHCLLHLFYFKYKVKSALQKSDYIIEVDKDKCKDCGECRERCIYGAIKEVDDKIILDQEICFGCGVCRLVCPTEARKLVLRG